MKKLLILSGSFLFAAPAFAQLFPNPATTELRIQTNEAIRSVLLTDLNGLYLYLVRVETASGVTTQKLLVQH